MTQIKSTFLIDDDNVFNLIHTKLIEKTNFAKEIKVFDNATDALRIFSILADSKPEMMPELIFLDINMPVMDGWEFLDGLNAYPQEVFEKCRVIMLSSSIDLNDVERSKTYKMVSDFISKPLTASKLQMLAGKLNDMPCEA